MKSTMFESSLPSALHASLPNFSANLVSCPITFSVRLKAMTSDVPSPYASSKALPFNPLEIP